LVKKRGSSRAATQEQTMDITKTLAELKQQPGFTDHVGMMLVHNGVVRAWSRADQSPVRLVRVRPDRERIRSICRELEQRPGIFRILAEAAEGELSPGDDLLFLVVAGDLRENVKSAFAELLDRIKAEAVIKEELT
jgi:molybdopterin synthase catalytic subunit